MNNGKKVGVWELEFLFRMNEIHFHSFSVRLNSKSSAISMFLFSRHSKYLPLIISSFLFVTFVAFVSSTSLVILNKWEILCSISALARTFDGNAIAIFFISTETLWRFSSPCFKVRIKLMFENLWLEIESA